MFRGSLQARTLGSVSFAHPTMSGVGTLGEPLGRKRERWWVIEMTITSSMDTFSNTGNVPTLYQPTVTVPTVTHTPTVADPHHLPQVSTHTKTLQNALGVKTVNAREKVCIYVQSYIRLVASYCYIFYVFLFFVLRQHSCVVHVQCRGVLSQLNWGLVHNQMLCCSHCHALATISHLPIFSVLSAVGTQCTASVCVFLQFSGMGCVCACDLVSTLILFQR